MRKCGIILSALITAGYAGAETLTLWPSDICAPKANAGATFAVSVTPSERQKTILLNGAVS